MIQWLKHMGDVVSLRDFSSLFLIYLIGLYVSPMIMQRYRASGQFAVLLKYPLFITAVLDELNHSRLKFIQLLAIILITNFSTMYISFLVGFIPYLPYLMIFYLGLNLGLTQLLLLPDKPLWILFTNPIALMEIPAILLAASAGLHLNLHEMNVFQFKTHLILFSETLVFLVKYPMMILIFSGILESWLVILSRKLLPGE